MATTWTETTWTWTELVAEYLLAAEQCPRCDAALQGSQHCPNCAADLSGPEAARVWQASEHAASAVRQRQQLIAALPAGVAAPAPVHPAAVAGPAANAGPAPSVSPAPSAAPIATQATRQPATRQPAPQPATPQPANTSQVSVQSVLAVAGAALFAIAAIVFAFLNPDLDFALRTTVIAAVTVVFLGGAWLLRRRGVRFSAEAIGALGMVFLALDVQALAEVAPGGVSGWWAAAVGASGAAALTLAIGWAARVRTWWWTGLVWLVSVPAFLGFAAAETVGEYGDVRDAMWWWAWGWVGVAAITVAGRDMLQGARERFASPLRADRVTLDVVQIVASGFGAVVVLVLATAPATSAGPSVDALARGAVLAALGIAAAFAAPHGASRFWSWATGGFAAAAITVAAFAITVSDPAWFLAIVPAAAAVALGAGGWLGQRGPVRRRPVQAGALTVAIVTALPAVSGLAATGLTVTGGFVLAVTGYTRGGSQTDAFGAGLPPTAGLAFVLGLAALAVGATVLALGVRRSEERADDAPADASDAGLAPVPSASPVPSARFSSAMFALAGWFAAGAATMLIGWTGLLPAGQAVVGVVIALVATGVVLVSSPPLPERARWMQRAIRLPFIVVAHTALVEAALASWSDRATVVWTGVAIVAALIVVGRTLPYGARFAHLAAAYAYALVLFATALDLAGLDTLPVLSLTATAGAAGALVATLVPRVGARAWYAILVVTAVPFLIGVATVIWQPNGWSALSTGATFALALALVLTRRPGLNRLVRSAAAALLVPSLAVVVVCLGSQFLETSGSPVVLPIIAVIVAVVLPATRAIETLLTRRGLGAGDAASARLSIELSALVTGAIAVLLALVREAAGLGTAIAVLVILGLGAAATSVLAGRRYGWAVAAASWTGALWCVWAMLGVAVVEPYTLPPALAAVVVGGVVVARRGRGLGLFAAGLGAAVVPSLVLLAAVGSGAGSGWGGDGVADGGAVAWRTWALLAGSAVLLAGAQWLLARGSLGALSVPLAAAALVAAAAGPVQAVRYGWELDPLALADPDLVMLPALGLSVGGTVLALLAAASLRARAAIEERAAVPSASAALATRVLASRWLYAPALAFLVVGPIAAIRRDWFAIWTLWTLMALLLALAVWTVARARRARPVLPPFWFTYALAWVTGVAGWGERDLRVEVFSLPLGLAVLAAGVVAMVPVRGGDGEVTVVHRVPPTLNSWPLGFRGSWALLAPGIVLTFLPSVLATGTDPQLYRPILVIALALAAILVGSARRLAAPFILGLAVLPLENIVVFAAQLDRTVGAMPWWITLATAGAVLLAIAVGSERRANEGRGVVARLRELE